MRKYYFDLQLFADEPGGDPVGGSEKKGGNGGHGGNAGYTYEQLEEIASSRSERASRSALADFFRKQGMDEDEITTAINDYKLKKQQSQPDIARITKERDEALEKLKERDNMDLLLKKGVKSNDLDYVAFKVKSLVDDKTSFEKAAEKWLKENPKFTGAGYRVVNSSVSGNDQDADRGNGDINSRIRAAARR